MSLARTAANCPLPIVSSTVVQPSANPLVGPTLTDSATMVTKVKEIATRADLAGRLGGVGVIGIVSGLAISAGSGLTLNVAAGMASIDGLIGRTATTTVMPNGATRFVWLKQDGTIALTSTTSPPVGNDCFLGTVTTSGGAITDVDTSGIMYLSGGIAWRQTADAGGPTDSPPAACRFIVKTAFSTYLWDGAAYHQLEIPLVGADPASPINGDKWFRTDSFEFKVRTGGATKKSAAFT